MHELSIAESIVSIALRHAAGRRVSRVEMQLGRLRQATTDALAFSFQLLSKGTVLEGAELAIDEVPAEVHCRACGSESRLDDFPAACRACGALDVDVIRGEELRVDALEVAEASASDEARSFTRP